MVRLPAVAGRFYSDEPAMLAQQVASLSVPDPDFPISPPDNNLTPAPAGRAVACMVPHAGYRFSGRVAGVVYASLRLPHRFLLIGPRHYLRGREQAILSQGSWQTPLGRAEIDSALADELKQAWSGLIEDEAAHHEEHALEVQLPFLQCLAGKFRFVPIALGTMDFDKLAALGQAIATVLARQREPVLIVASSDMNHYESDEITRIKDRKALDCILALDARGLYDVVRREEITMCGCNAAVSMLTAASLLGASSANLVGYATSGGITGDLTEVVGYAGVVVA